MTNAHLSPILTALEVARYLRIDEDHNAEVDIVRAVQRLVTNHGLRPIRATRPYKFHVAEVEDLDAPADEGMERGKRIMTLETALIDGLTGVRDCVVAGSDDEVLIPARRLARMLGVSVRTVRGWDAAGRIPRAVQLGRMKRWDRREVLAWIDAGLPSRPLVRHQREPLMFWPPPLMSRNEMLQELKVSEPQPWAPATGVKPLLVRDHEAAAMLSVSRRFIHQLAARGILERVHLGRATRYRVEDVERIAANGVPDLSLMEDDGR